MWFILRRGVAVEQSAREIPHNIEWSCRNGCLSVNFHQVILILHCRASIILAQSKTSPLSNTQLTGRGNP